MRSLYHDSKDSQIAAVLPLHQLHVSRKTHVFAGNVMQLKHINEKNVKLNVDADGFR